MSTSIHGLLTGSFVSDGLARHISLPCGYDSFELINLTDIGSAAAATPVMKARGTSLMPAASAYYNTKTNGAATIDIETTTLTNGFSFLVDSGLQTPSTAVVNAAGGITRAAPAVVTSATLPVDGSIVRMYNTTGMLQIAGMDFTTAGAGGPSFNLAYLDSQAANGFGAAATANSFRVIPFDARFYPRRRFITKITAANPAVVTLSVTHGFLVGEKVRMIVPAFPSTWTNQTMFEMDQQLATITAIDTVNNTITIDVDSSAFTPFHFPQSAEAALGWKMPQVVPVGEAATHPYENLLDDATLNTSITGVTIGTSVQTTGKTYQWIARRGQSI